MEWKLPQLAVRYMKADSIFLNGRIFTADSRCPWAREMAVLGDRFVAVGEPGCTRDLMGSQTRIVDLGDQLVLPGLCDSHIHFTNYALSRRELDLFEVPSLPELKRRLQAHGSGQTADAWIVGRGWNQDLWPEKRFPTRQDLDEAAGPRPVLLWAKSGHAAVASSAALRMAAVGPGAVAPSGGSVELAADGVPTGMLLEAPAIQLVARHIPEPSMDTLVDAALEAQVQMHAWGITAVHDFDGRQGLTVFQEMENRRLLRLRAVNHIAQDQLDDAIRFGVRGPLGNPWFRLGGLKLFADGALGPRTALMLEPYVGEPDNYGIAVLDKEEMLELVARATRHGIASCVHAIGDRANHDVLDVFQEARRIEREKGVPRAARRHRIEHVQVIEEADMPRFRDLGINAAVQPIHATQDMEMVDRYWGARGRNAYAFRTLREKGVRLAFGSDAPVETPNPFVGMHAAITRRRADGAPNETGWYPEQRLSREETLLGYTLQAAYLEGVEATQGSIQPGKFADFFVPDRDLLQCAADEIPTASSRLTVVGGTSASRQFHLA